MKRAGKPAAKAVTAAVGKARKPTSTPTRTPTRSTSPRRTRKTASPGSDVAATGANVLAFRAWRPVGPRRDAPALSRPNIAWRLTDDDENLQVCTIDPPAAGSRASWIVTVWLNDTRLFTRRCADGAAADFVASALRQDQLLGGAVPVGRLRHFKRR